MAKFKKGDKVRILPTAIIPRKLTGIYAVGDEVYTLQSSVVPYVNKNPNAPIGHPDTGFFSEKELELVENTLYSVANSSAQLEFELDCAEDFGHYNTTYPHHRPTPDFLSGHWPLPTKCCAAPNIVKNYVKPSATAISFLVCTKCKQEVKDKEGTLC